MYLIVGLGNPGENYEKTRHNVGFMVIDELISNPKSQKYNSKLKSDKKLKAEIWDMRIGNERVILAKPLTFMNNSGQAVKKLTRSYHLEARSLIVIHDDLDIPLGKYKIQFGKGPREHGGVESVEQALGTKEFWRIRVGIENENTRSREHKITRTKRISGEEYVLQEFRREEREIIDKVVLKVVEEF